MDREGQPTGSTAACDPVRFEKTVFGMKAPLSAGIEPRVHFTREKPEEKRRQRGKGRVWPRETALNLLPPTVIRGSQLWAF